MLGLGYFGLFAATVFLEMLHDIFFENPDGVRNEMARSCSGSRVVAKRRRRGESRDGRSFNQLFQLHWRQWAAEKRILNAHSKLFLDPHQFRAMRGDGQGKFIFEFAQILVPPQIPDRMFAGNAEV
jgi:hypothetical protein